MDPAGAGRGRVMEGRTGTPGPRGEHASVDTLRTGIAVPGGRQTVPPRDDSLSPRSGSASLTGGPLRVALPPPTLGHLPDGGRRWSHTGSTVAIDATRIPREYNGVRPVA